MSFKKGQSGNLATAWKKGQSGNPAGRPKDPIGCAVREVVDRPLPPRVFEQLRKTFAISKEITIYEGIVLRFCAAALAGDVQAAKAIIERREGKMPLPVNVGDANGDALIPTETLKAALDAIAKRRASEPKKENE